MTEATWRVTIQVVKDSAVTFKVYNVSASVAGTLAVSYGPQNKQHFPDILGFAAYLSKQDSPLIEFLQNVPLSAYDEEILLEDVSWDTMLDDIQYLTAMLHGVLITTVSDPLNAWEAPCQAYAYNGRVCHSEAELVWPVMDLGKEIGLPSDAEVF